MGDAHPSQPSSASESPSSISPTISYGSRFSLAAEDGQRCHMNLVGVNMSNAQYGRHFRSDLIDRYDNLRVFFFFHNTESSSLVAEYGSEGYSTSTTTTRHSVSENERCVRPRRSYSGPHPHPRAGDLYGTDTSPPDSDNFNSEDHSSINGGNLHTRPRRHTTASMIPHSPSLSPPPIRGNDFRERDMSVSNTLAVIKAQAFGSLRRTRTRAKKTSDAASRVAVDLLSARGIGLGLQSPVMGGTSPRLRTKRKSECLDDVTM